MSNKKKGYYAVRAGHQPGIYLTWDECSAQVKGYPKADFKGFSTRAEAEAYLTNGKSAVASPPPKPKAEALPTMFAALPAQSNGLKHVVIYTDGACTGNPGRGGYGVVLLHGEHRKEMSGGFRLTTNNRMELLACIIGLKSLKGRCEVSLYSDSKYVVDSITKGWALRWRKNDWVKDDQPVRNADLWEQMLDLCAQHRVKFHWVRGHAGNEENERCDELARAAAASNNLATDSAYESKL